MFLTGGTGWVGGAVLRHLVEAGHQVTALARSEASATWLEESGATAVRGDLLDGAVLRTAMVGTGIVFHVAGVNDMCARDPGEMYRVNVEGPRAVVEAAASSGVERVVLTSSAATIGERRGTVGRETDHHNGRYLSHYARSKHLGEQAFFEAAAASGIDAVAVNPSSVQGPGRATGSARLFLAAARSAVAIDSDIPLAIVDPDDCARGHLAAAARGLPGRRYLLSGPAITIGEVFRLIDLRLGSTRPRIHVPRALIAAIGYPAGVIASLGAAPALLCVESVRTVLHGHRFDPEAARRDLAMGFVSPGETIGRTLDWFASRSLID